MAARRLIAVLIVLLIISSLAAALAPQQESSETDATDPETNITRPDEGPAASADGELLLETIPADPERPTAIDVVVGDQLQLLVKVAVPSRVRVPELGLSAFATPGDPARFDVLLREAGELDVTAGGGRVARLEISEPEPGCEEGEGRKRAGCSGASPSGSGT